VSPLSQEFPVLVPACCHRPATPQHCGRAARALRNYSHTKAQKDFMGVERLQFRKDQELVLPGTADVLGLFSPAPPEVPLKV